MDTKGALIRFFRSLDFEGHRLILIVFKGRGCLFTAQLGEAIGYEEGRFLVDSIMDDWRQDFRESYHYDVLRGDELRQLKDVLAQPSGLKPEGAPKKGDPSGLKPEGWLDSNTAQVMVLYEPGIYLALNYTRKAAGQRFRAWLADVLPDLARSSRERNGEGTKARKPRKNLFDSPGGQLYELIQAHEGRGPDGERLPWVATEEEVVCRWNGPLKGKRKIREMLQYLVEEGRVAKNPVGILVYEFSALTDEERSTRAASLTERQLTLPEPPLKR